MSRNSDEFPKDGSRTKGKTYKSTLIHVWDVPCPESEGNHELTSDEEKNLCAHCKVLWSELDKALNNRGG